MDARDWEREVTKALERKLNALLQKLPMRADRVSEALEYWAKNECPEYRGEPIHAALTKVSAKNIELSIELEFEDDRMADLTRSGQWAYLWPMVEMHKEDIKRILFTPGPHGSQKLSIYDSAHYTAPAHVQNGYDVNITIPGYDNRNYSIDIPKGQDIDTNVKAALSFKEYVDDKTGSNVYYGNILKKDYLQKTVATGSAGDYGKNSKLYPDSNLHKSPMLYYQRRLAANFNFGTVGAALGYSLESLLLSAEGLAEAGTVKQFWKDQPMGGVLHPQEEQDAIEDGYWYFYTTHPDRAQHDNVTVPTGIKFGIYKTR